MKKAIVSVCLVISLITCMTFVLSATFTHESGFSYIPLEDGCNAEITGYESSSIDVHIPTEIGGFSITGISNAAFKGNNDVWFLEVPDGVNYIGKEAFADCSKLQTITLPNTLQYIGEDALSGCTELRSVFYRGTRKQWSTVFGADMIHTEKIQFAYESGDINGNWRVSGSDSYLLKKYLAGHSVLDSNETLAADLTSDGIIDSKDSYLLKRILCGDRIPYKLIVNDIEVSGDFSIYLHREADPYPYMEVPILAILKELGAEIEWTGKASADIFYKDKVYVFDGISHSIVLEGYEHNLIGPLPGGYSFPDNYRFTGSDLIIDEGAAEHVCFLMGHRVSIVCDSETHTVYVKSVFYNNGQLTD